MKCLVSCVGELCCSVYCGGTGKYLLAHKRYAMMLYAGLQNSDRSWSRIRAGVDGNMWKKGANQLRSTQKTQ